MGEIRDYLIDLNTLLVDVIKKKMSGNTHHDYSNLMNLLHTLAESKFFFGDVNISELAVKWKEVVEMKGRQLRRKKLIQVPYTVDGYTVELTDFADSEAMSLRHIYTDTESDSVSRRTTKSRGTKRSSEADSEKTTKRRRKRAAAPPASDESHLAVRLNVQQVDGRAVYSFSEVVDQTPVVAKTRGRKPRAASAASAAASASAAEEKDFARKVKKPQFEVYFDLSSEINKMSYNMYRENWQNYPREKWYCCVCFGDDDMPQNPMLRCACCGCIVHKYCYGVDPLPSNPSEWLCDYCQYVKDNGLTWKGQELVGMRDEESDGVGLSAVLLHRRVLQEDGDEQLGARAVRGVGERDPLRRRAPHAQRERHREHSRQHAEVQVLLVPQDG